MKKKGFTLIELLAVIVILAIIALIATPIVLNLIEKARRGAAESSAYAYIKAAENAAMVSLIDNPSVNITSATCTVTENGKSLSCVSGENTTTLAVDAKGTLPENGGTITLNDKGATTGANFTINGYNVLIDANGKASINE